MEKDEVPLKSKTKEQLEEDMKEAKAELHNTEEAIGQYHVSLVLPVAFLTHLVDY